MGIETQENADNYSDCVEPQITYKTQKTGCVFDVSPENLLYNTVLKVSYVARIFIKYKATRRYQKPKTHGIYLEWFGMDGAGNFRMLRVRKRCLRAQNGKSIKLNVKCIHSHKKFVS